MRVCINCNRKDGDGPKASKGEEYGANRALYMVVAIVVQVVGMIDIVVVAV